MSSVGWEKAVIATVLHDPQTMDEAGDLLPADFTDERQDIWSEMMMLHSNGALESRALMEALRDRNVIEDGIVGDMYMEDVLQHRGTAIEEYASRVLGASNKRQLMQIAGVIIADAQDENVDAQEAFDNAERRLLTLRRNRSSELGVPLGSIISAFNDKIDGLRAGTIVPAWVPEIEPLRWILQYIDEEDFIVLGGRPGEGKTSIMRYMFVEAAMAVEMGMSAIDYSIKACEADADKYCLDVKAGEGRIVSCLVENEAKLNKECITALKETGLWNLGAK